MSDTPIDREALAREVWGSDADLVQLNVDVAPNDADPAPAAAAPQDAPQGDATTTAQDQPQDDPWANVPAVLRQEFESMRTKLSATETLETRVKQAERRLGSVQNELNAAKEAARTAPTAEQVEAEAKTRRQWEDLQASFPEIAEGTEARLTMEREAMTKLIPDAEVVRRQMSEELQQYKNELAGNLVAMKHPDWQQVNQSPEFKAWNESTGNRDSFNPLEVIAILDEYQSYRATKLSPKQIEGQRQQRLEQSQTTQGRRLSPAKTEADMSPAELRAHIAKQVWTSN